MSQPRAVDAQERQQILSLLRATVGRGEYLLAYDQASEAHASFPDELEIAYFMVLALARSGATDRALAELQHLGLDRRAGTDAPPDLAGDVAALTARLAKDRALETSGAERRRRARRAAELYEAIYDERGRAYPCINAATMWLVAGDLEKASALANAALASCHLASTQSPAQAYWLAATEAEASLLLDDADAAGAALERAGGEAVAEPAARATTRAQLALICELKGIDLGVLAPLAIPKVIHYCGHMISPPGEPGRLPASAEEDVARRIGAYLDDDRVGIAFGSLAAGADLLFAEALLRRGAELHVVLPMAIPEFARVSVAPGSAAWLERFQSCLSRATSVTLATDGEYLDDAELFDYGARVAMGHALIRATFLAADVEQVALWDGYPSMGLGGTAANIEVWQRGGRRVHVIPSRYGDAVPDELGEFGLPTARTRAVRAMLFGDIRGFSELTDAQISRFLDVVLSPLAAALDRFGDDVLYRNSWGDGLYVVLRDVTAAANCALALQQTMKELDLAQAGLPDQLGLRIGAHAGPVLESRDPVRRERNFYGVHVTRTARIEPRTPEGDVYVTDAFASLLVLEADRSLSCQYVGHIPTAKDYGTFPMYVLKRRA